MTEVAVESLSPIKNSSLYFIIKWRSLSILKHATANEKKLFRKVEKTFNKVKKQQLDIEFNQICPLFFMRNRVLPTKLWGYHHGQTALCCLLLAQLYDF